MSDSDGALLLNVYFAFIYQCCLDCNLICHLLLLFIRAGVMMRMTTIMFIIQIQR